MNREKGKTGSGGETVSVPACITSNALIFRKLSLDFSRLMEEKDKLRVEN